MVEFFWLVTHPDVWPAQKRNKVAAVASNDNCNLIMAKIFLVVVR